MDIKLYFSLWWSGVLIPRLAMMTWKYTSSMDMCLSVQLAEIMPIWQLSALIFIRPYIARLPVSCHCSKFIAITTCTMSNSGFHNAISLCRISRWYLRLSVFPLSLTDLARWLALRSIATRLSASTWWFLCNWRSTVAEIMLQWNLSITTT